MSTYVDVWRGGDNLDLVDKVACIAAKHVGRYEDMVKEMTNFFTKETKKVEIMKSCSEKMRDVANRFKADRRAPKSGAMVPTLFQLAQELREKKKKFLEATIGDQQVYLTVGARMPPGSSRDDIQYLTPQKSLPTVKVVVDRQLRITMMEKLRQPIFSMEDLTAQEKEEADLHRQQLKKRAEDDRTESWNDNSVEKENFAMARLIEVAFRALLAENVKRYEVYKGNSGNGDIRWDYEVKQLDKTDNDIFYMAKAAYAAKIMQVKGSDSLKPSKLMDVLETERIKYEWFLGMFLEEDEAEDAVWQLEQSLGQIIQSSLLNNGDTGMQLYVSMAEENPKVQEGKMSLFAFYRTKFTRLRAGEQSSKPTRSPYKVNHISEGESPASEDMPDVR